MVMATTHVDLHGEKFSLKALQSLASQLEKEYLPININHDIRHPPAGRGSSAEVVKLSDGEWGVLATGELYEESDTLESLAGDGRKIRIRDEDIETISVEYDRTFADGAGKELIRELSQISESTLTYKVKKAYEPISMLIIAIGVFVVGSIATGFFRKIGYDIYDKLKDTLSNYYRKKEPSDQILDFCVLSQKDDRIFEVHVLITNPPSKDVADFFANGLNEVDALLLSLPLDKAKDLAQLVLGYKDQKLTIRYAVNSASVPFSFYAKKRKDMQ